MESTSWSPPLYDVAQPPRLLATRTLVGDSSFPHNFARSARWCPDGSAALAHCEDRSFKFVDLPEELKPSGTDTTAQPVRPLRTLRQAGAILDFAWYPAASAYNPAAFCFAASVRDCPVKLLDGSDGRLRASYKIVDHRERQVAPHSLVFSPQADKLYCGFEDAIELFDLHRPGEGTRLHTTPSKKTKTGLKGIVSALAFAPAYASPLLAAGSLAAGSAGAANIGLLAPDGRGAPFAFCGAPAGVRAGVSQLAFNPAQPHVLYAAFRRDGGIYAWDLRGDVDAPVRVYRRKTRGRDESNQRIRFDVDSGGRWLCTGDQSGQVYMFDLSERQDAPTLDPETGLYSAGHEDVPETAPTLQYSAHGDAVGSVGFHPLQPVVLSASGSRTWDEADGAEDGSSSGTDSDSESESEQPRRAPRVLKLAPRPRDASFKFWSFDRPESGGADT